MAETQGTSFEKQELPSPHTIPDQYKELFGYEEFEVKFNQSSEQDKKILSQIFQSQVDSKAFLAYVEDDLCDKNPIDSELMAFISNKYGNGNSSIEFDERPIDSELMAFTSNKYRSIEFERSSQNVETQKEITAQGIFDKYGNILGASFNLDDPKKSYKLIHENYKELQQAALEKDKQEGKIDENGKPTSDSNSAQLNTQLQDLADLGAIPSFETALSEITESPNNSVGLDADIAAKTGMDTSTYEVAEVDGETLTYGDQVIDFGEKPPVKYIASESSEWKLKSTELDFSRDSELYKERDGLESELGDIQKELLPFDENITRIEKQLGTLTNLDLRSSNAREQLGEHFAQVMPRTGIVEQIENMEGLQGQALDNAIIRLKNKIGNFLETKGGELQGKQKELQQRKVEVEKRIIQINTKIETQEALFAERVREEDEKTRQIGQFIKQIGLDLLPQSAINQVVAEVNIKKNIDLGAGISINTNIALEEGVYGYTDAMEGTSDREEEALIRLFNKMISGEPDGPNAPLDDVAGYAAQRRVADPIEMRAKLASSGILTESGVLDFEQVRKNLWTEEPA